MFQNKVPSFREALRGSKSRDEPFFFRIQGIYLPKSLEAFLEKLEGVRSEFRPGGFLGNRSPDPPALGGLCARKCTEKRKRIFSCPLSDRIINRGYL